MKVLMLSKACIVGTYQKKLEEIAALPGVDLTVVVPPSWNDPHSPTMLEKIHLDGYEMIVTPMTWNGHFHIHYYPHLKHIVRRIRPDVFHIDEEPYNLSTFQAMRLARQVGARSVVFTWQNIYRRYPPPFGLMERYVLKRADALLVGNYEAEGVWRQKGYRGHIEQIPQFGVDTSIYYRHKRPTRRGRMSAFKFRSVSPPTQPTLAIGYIGRLVPE
ncbi:glycosyltransferase, partial [Anaerolineales bacterium HSG24]|nr:glycosyltransferase [Anaerolineales bacterium HSG24]